MTFCAFTLGAGGAERRIDERVRELEEVRERIRAFRAERPDVLAGEAERELTGTDPRRGA